MQPHPPNPPVRSFHFALVFEETNNFNEVMRRQKICAQTTFLKVEMASPDFYFPIFSKKEQADRKENIR